MDQYTPFHPDNIVEGVTLGNAATYYPRIVALFEALERAYQCRVVVAAHPRSDYDRHPDYFGGRTVLRGETAKLISRARLVITQHSLANSFCVMFRKPMLVVCTDDMLRHDIVARDLRLFSELAGSPALNIDHPWQLPDPASLRVNEERYARYERLVLKRKDTPEMNTWEIVGRFFHARGLGHDQESSTVGARMEPTSNTQLSRE